MQRLLILVLLLLLLRLISLAPPLLLLPLQLVTAWAATASKSPWRLLLQMQR